MLIDTNGGRVLVGAVALVAAATMYGLVSLWPHGHHHHGSSDAFGGKTIGAKVVESQTIRCPGPTTQACRRLIVDVRGQRGGITLGPVTASPNIGTGTRIRVTKTPPVPANVVSQAGQTGGVSAERFQFVDVDRRGSIVVLGIALALLALVVLRWRGLLAALGVGLSLLLVTFFIVPAILDGEPALLVALVGALAVMFVTLIMTSGIGPQTMAAALGIASTLLLACGLALLSVQLAHLDGRFDELSLYLGQQNENLSLQGVVLAGMVIGALGVLADSAVTQSSAVMSLRRADPSLSARGLYHGAFSIGRDHMSATIHTLVLAYVGASLPLLLLLRSSGVSVIDAVNGQQIAEPIIATLVGTIALIAAVPITTALAATISTRVPTAALGHIHAHHH